jgi:hypothetical protein
MAMNLRLRPDLEAALRDEALRSGRSQQEILRAALARYLSPAVGGSTAIDRDPLVASGQILPPRTPYQRVMPVLPPPDGMTSLDLLDRDERR